MKTNILNNNYVKTLGLIGAAGSIAFSIYRNSGLWKGVGNYFLFTVSGAIVGAGLYSITKQKN
jgi:hypothetical protein